MFTEKFTQKAHFLWRISKHSQAPLISHRTTHGCLLQISAVLKFQNVITMHTLSSGYSVVTPCIGKENMSSSLKRSYQVVVAATRDMGIGKDGKLPWNFPSDLRYFKELTTTVSTTGKRNAVIMGRKTWESIPLKYRPLPGRLNVVLTRSGKLEALDSEDLIMCSDLPLALKLLAEPPHSFGVEKVFVIGGGQVLKEALNVSACEAVHLTDIETNFDCDTFIPEIDSSLFRKWCSTGPIVENGVPFSFVTYVPARMLAEESSASQKGIECDTTRMPEELCSEFNHLKRVQELIASGHTGK